MSHYIVVENNSGLLVAEVPGDKQEEEVAISMEGVIVDAGPYPTYEDAYDAMLQVPDDLQERSRLRD